MRTRLSLSTVPAVLALVLLAAALPSAAAADALRQPFIIPEGAEVFLISTGPQGVEGERYFHELCRLLAQDGMLQSRYLRIKVMRIDTEDFTTLRNQLTKQGLERSTDIATALGIIEDALLEGHWDCRARGSTQPPASWSRKRLREVPKAFVLIRRLEQQGPPRLRLERAILVPGTPMQPLEGPHYLDDLRDPQDAARQIGLMALDIPEKSLIRAVLTLESEHFTECRSVPLQEFCLPIGHEARLVLELKNSPWVTLQQVSVQFSASCDTQDKTRIERLLEEATLNSDDQGRRISVGLTYLARGTCTFKAKLLLRNEKSTEAETEARLHISARPVLVTRNSNPRLPPTSTNPGPSSPRRQLSVLLARRKPAPWVVSSELFLDPPTFGNLRVLSGEQVLEFGQNVRAAILALPLPQEVPELESRLSGVVKESLDALYDSLGFRLMDTAPLIYWAATGILSADPFPCGLLVDRMKEVASEAGVTLNSALRWEWGCNVKVAEVRLQLSRIVEPKAPARLRIARPPSTKGKLYRAIEGVAGLEVRPPVEFPADGIAFTQSIGVATLHEERYLLAGLDEGGEVSPYTTLLVKNLAVPDNIEFGALLQWGRFEGKSYFSPVAELAFPFLDRRLLVGVSADHAGGALGVTPSLSVDWTLLSPLGVHVIPGSMPINILFGGGYDVLRDQPRYFLEVAYHRRAKQDPLIVRRIRLQAGAAGGELFVRVGANLELFP